MTTNTMKKAAGAINSNGQHTDANSADFDTDGTRSKATAIAPPIAPSPDKAAILAALTKLIDTPDVFTVQSLTTKKQIKAAMRGTAK